MAPLSVSSADDATTPVPRARKPLRQFIPAVPRQFENKKPKSGNGTPKSLSVVGEQDVKIETHAPNISSTQTLTAEESQETPRTSPEYTTLNSIDIPEVPPDPVGTGTLGDETFPASTSPFTHDIESENSGFQLPPALYPTPTTNHVTSSVQTPTNSQPEGFLGHPRPKLFSPYPLDRNIVFGGQPESDQSSPVSLPSGSSTTCTQPTPLSDAPSFRSHSQSQSLYQGYGHVPTTYEHQFPSNLVIVGQQDVYIHPPYTSSSDGGYSQPVPLFSTGYRSDELSSDHALIEAPPSDEQLQLNRLGTYLLNHFNQPSFADCRVDIDVGGTRTELMLHRLLLFQCPKLQSLIQASNLRDNSSEMTIIALNDGNDSNLRTSSLISALRSLYGESPSVHAQQTNDLETALAFLAAGRLLQIPEYQDIGRRAIPRYSTMDNVETLLSYALKSTAPFVGPDGRVTNEMRTEFEMSDKLIAGLVELVAASFPKPFILDTQAPASKDLRGLPPVSKPEQTQRSKPELMALRFGEFPSASQAIPSTESTFMSTILLSIPFEVLQQLLGTLGPETQREVATPVVHEREKRRLKVLETRPTPDQDSGDDKLYWQEQAMDSPQGSIITRIWVGSSE